MGCGQTSCYSKGNDDDQSTLSKPYIFFVTGGPGSGKGTQCQKLVQDYRFKHLSIGDILREQQTKGGLLGEELKQLMSSGKLVSSEMVVRLLKKQLAFHGNRRYLIDGFPRNIDNLSKFRDIMKDDVIVKMLIFFKCSSQIMKERILDRAKTSGRSDDNIESIKLRLETYQSQTLPIIQRFQSEGNCLQINADQSKDVVYKQLKENLSRKNIYPPGPAIIIFVLGGPGSGKGTQCQKLVHKFGFKHLSTGDLLRESVKNGSGKCRQIQDCMKNGKLVSSELLVGLIEERLEKYNFGGRYLLDGFPRGHQNIEAWNKILQKWAHVKAIIYFKCQEGELIKRLLERAKTSGRLDDNQQTIKKRLEVFSKQTKPVINIYSDQGKVIQVDAMRSIQEVQNNVSSELQNIGIFEKKRNLNNPKIICVLGGPGSGKGTQCEKIQEKFKFKHLSTGDVLRQEQKNNGLYADIINECIQEGKLVSSQILVILIKKKLSLYGKADTILLDGFPRNQENINKWEEVIGIDLQFNNIIYFQCSEKAMEERLMNRAKTSGRSDDNPETIRKRFEVFSHQTVPIVHKLASITDFVITVNAEQPPDAIFQSLKDRLIKKGYKSD